MRQIPKKMPEKPGAGGGGMTKEDRKKLDDTVEQMLTIQDSFTRLSSMIYNLGVEQIKDELKKVGDKAS